MKGVVLSARYAFMPNSLGYCGKPAFSSALERGDGRQLRSELKKFAAHYAYLELIASCNSKKPFDEEVVEAFWIGNPLLENVGREDIADTLRGFGKEGLVGGKRCGELVSEIPGGAVPHHSFHVLHVNSLSGALGPETGGLDRCRVGWGTVLRTEGGRATVLYRPLCGKKGGYCLGKEREKRIFTCWHGYSCLGDVRKGDIIAFHWDFAVQKIGKHEAEMLERYTLQNINAVNSCVVG